jgi:hypothetical protein
VQYAWRHNTQHKDTQHKDTQHNKTKNTTLGINNTWHNATGHYAKCHYAERGYAGCHFFIVMLIVVCRHVLVRVGAAYTDYCIHILKAWVR